MNCYADRFGALTILWQLNNLCRMDSSNRPILVVLAGSAPLHNTQYTRFITSCHRRRFDIIIPKRKYEDTSYRVTVLALYL